MTKKMLIASVAIALAGCGGGGGTSGQPQTSKEKIAALESSGAIPKLERGTSVAGTDANSNGVRDDVETYITSHYPAELQAAALQTAKALQETLLADLTNMTSVKAIDTRVTRGIHCIYSKTTGEGTSLQPAQVVQELESITTNTKKIAGLSRV